MADAVETLRSGHGFVVDIDGRQIRLVEPVKGDPGNAVLKTLGIVEGVSPIGAAAHGPTGVAAGVWRNPELYLVRWTKGRRWVAGYRLGGGSGPNHYVRTEGRIPTRFETGNWYGDVPDEIDEAFLEGDLMLEDPPFPLPVAPPPPTPVRSEPVGAKRARPASRAPRATAPDKAVVAKVKPVTTRVCASCSMQKALAQFVAGADLCVDCR